MSEYRYLTKYYNYFITIRTGSPERREQIIQEIKDLPWFKLDYSMFEFYKDGECDLFINVDTKGAIHGKEFIEFRQKHHDVSEEIRVFVIGNDLRLESHTKYNSDTWEKLWTKEDCMADISCKWAMSGRFNPEDLNMHISRSVYDLQDNLLFEEKKTLPLPIEEMFEDLSAGEIQEQYELWKKNPYRWEELWKEIERQRPWWVRDPSWTDYYQRMPDGECIMYERRKSFENYELPADAVMMRPERNDNEGEDELPF